ncbi:hypothetical protein B5X24_HaOG214809 [Helicoverpa armigera]|uniref:Uncharacterized protein n=1 Tax=Helicoverpa armigera TaxID=29058 RepID=A0A2W1B6E5_HELAM|nr:hypothetical protein B5X24_HaOG214809 [Helicoverpa armigera]
MGYLADMGILPAECQETADLLLFFDELFDSVNGSYDNSKKRAGKPLLGPANDFTNIGALRALYEALVKSSGVRAKYKTMLERKYIRYMYLKRNGIHPGYPLLHPTLFYLEFYDSDKTKKKRKPEKSNYSRHRVERLVRHGITNEWNERRRTPPDEEEAFLKQGSGGSSDAAEKPAKWTVLEADDRPAMASHGAYSVHYADHSVEEMENPRGGLQVVQSKGDLPEGQEMPGSELARHWKGTVPPEPVREEPLLPSTTPSNQPWIKVVPRKRKGKKSAPEPPAAKPAALEDKRRKLARPKTEAVVVTLTPEAAERGETYESVLRRARTNVDPAELGAGRVTCRKTQTGARISEFSRAQRGTKADLFATKLREAVADTARVVRAVKCVALEVTDLDDSVTQEEVVAAVAAAGMQVMATLELRLSDLTPPLTPSERRAFTILRDDHTIITQCQATSAKLRTFVHYRRGQVSLLPQFHIRILFLPSLKPHPRDSYTLFFPCLQEFHIR